ncbi:hypothetical protein LTR08_000087 [Meristemomyces frigidus]|nr:hypothetical protein LTR08_000087 [Meristemomyces frigidus]
MNDPIDRGFPFQLQHLWPTSTPPLDPGQGSLFLPPDLELPDLTDGAEPGILQQGLELALPELAELNLTASPELEAIGGDTPTPSGTATAPGDEQREHQLDFWTLDTRPIDHLAPLTRTWEAFDRKTVLNADRTAYFSEAGPSALDAALATKGAEANTSVLPQDATLRALCNLALGRPSVFFQWDDTKRSFTQTLEDVPTAGLSIQCSQSFAAHIMDYGATYRNLQAFAESRDAACATVTAFKRSISRVLEATEFHITYKLPLVRTLLQLQSVLQKPQQLLRTLWSLTDDVKDAVGDEVAISMLADRVHAISDVGSGFTGLLRAMLAATCKPWLDGLAQDLGLANTRLSLWRGPLSATTVTSAEQVNLSLTEVVMVDDPSVTFLSTEDRSLIHQTRASLAILRQHLPNSDLCLPKPLRRASERSQDRLDLVADSGHQDVYQMNDDDAVTRPHTGEDQHTGQDAWTYGSGQTLEAMDARMSHSPDGSAVATDNSLHATTVAALLQTEPRPTTPHSHLQIEPWHTPFHTLRPLAEAQLTRLNSTLLQHLFTTCQLRKHLDLQHAFHLFGSGAFVSRLSTALFSSETQSAERKRDNIPTAETMGLRLGHRQGQTWPPASSELRLTLAGVLNEAYHSSTAAPGTAMAGKQLDLPGGLSFAIRELPDADIDRVMDASSLWALDFLRLQYSAPPPLDAVLTPLALENYDDIFRFLLRLLRVSQATTRLRRDQLARSSGETAEVIRRFVLEAHHFVSSVISYSLDIGISAPWRELNQTLDHIEKASAGENPSGPESSEANVGIAGLRDLHSRCLDSVRTRLFLKRRQEMTRQALETVLIAILAVAAALQSLPGQDHDVVGACVSDFHKAVSSLLEGLQSTVDKPSRVVGSGDAADADGATAILLLSKLNWNHFYDGKPS